MGEIPISLESESHQPWPAVYNPETIKSAAQTRHLKTSCEAPSEAALSETSAPVDLSQRWSFILSQLHNLHLMERLRRVQSVSRTERKSSTECQDGIYQK